MATATKTRQSKAKRTTKTKPTKTPKRKPEQVEQPADEPKVSRREIIDAIEDAAEKKKPLTVAQVHERYSTFGLGRLAKFVERGDWTIAGFKATGTDHGYSGNNELGQKLLTLHGKKRIEVVKRIRRRKSA
ncbi:MAG: hypothetical protein WD738_21350 [Pirellulales bacterium]